MSADDPKDHRRVERLEELLELQRVDSRIHQIQYKLDHLDAQQVLDDAKERAAEVEEERARHRVDLDRARAEQRKVEGEIELLTERRDAEQARMYSGDISSPKELQSIRAQIDATEERISQQEDQLLELMEVVDRLETHVDQLGERREQLEDRIEDLTEERDAAAQDLLAEQAELEVERDEHRESLPDELLERYEEALDAHSGMAVAELEGGMCTGCRLELPMIEREELLEGPPLGTCPQCGRLLVVP